MHESDRWYAVYTRAKCEQKVADLLSRRKIENFCPFNQIVQRADRKKTVYEPLFSSYVFVNATEAQHIAIKQTEGIINFVYWLDMPAVFKNGEIKIIKEFLNNYDNVGLEKMPVNINGQVRIVHGPLLSREGEVLEITNNNSTKVLLPSLGYALIAHKQKTQTEKVKVISFV